MRKKKSPVTEMVEAIHCRIDQLDTHQISRLDVNKALRAIEWNLKQSWQRGSDPYLGQAIGLVKGLRAGFGDYNDL